MDPQQIGLKLGLDAIGVPIRVASFPDRLILQKAVYLAQAAGVDLGYHYNWYLRGPYSPALTRDAFAIAAEIGEGVDDSHGCNLDPVSTGRLGQLRELIERIPQQDLPAKLELLASVRFLLRDPTTTDRVGVADLQTILQRYGKQFSDDEIRDGIEELERHGLCSRNRSR